MQSIAISDYTSALFQLTWLFQNTIQEKCSRRPKSPKVVANVLKSSTKISKTPKPNFRVPMAAKVAQLALFLPNLATLINTSATNSPK